LAAAENKGCGVRKLGSAVWNQCDLQQDRLYAPHTLDWIGVLFAAAAVVLVPWVVFLVRALPSQHRSAHWNVAWGGFDIALALLLVGVAVAAWRRRSSSSMRGSTS
jgi:hypothetical protein